MISSHHHSQTKVVSKLEGKWWCMSVSFITVRDFTRARTLSAQGEGVTTFALSISSL